MQAYKKTFISMFSAAVLTGGWGTAEAQLTTSELVANFEAGNNSLAASNRWENLGSLGGAVSGAGTPLLGCDETLIGWYSGDDTVRDAAGGWGLQNDPNYSPAPPLLNLLDFSVEVWARRLGGTAPGQNEHHFLMLRDFTFNQTFFIGLFTGLNPGVRDTFSYDFIDDLGTRQNGSTGVVMEKESIFGDFHQYVFVFDNDFGDFDLYVDGDTTPVFSITGLSPIFSDFSDMEVFIGGAPNEMGRRFQGDIGAFRVYDKELSTAEIAANFAHGPSACTTPDPVPIVNSTPATDTNVVEVTFDTESGTDYILQVASNVVDNTWLDEGQTVAGDGTSKRLYRLTDGQDSDILRVGRQ